jgi:hypothetical protein
MNASRDVYIEHKRHTYFVVFADRKRNGRYTAAQFNDVDSDLTKVEQWVRNNNKLNLIEK